MNRSSFRFILSAVWLTGAIASLLGGSFISAAFFFAIAILFLRSAMKKP